jgi:REP-associated tyrosine transposase
MPRLPRLYAPGCAHHIIQRGHNRSTCFFEDADRYFYLEALRDASRDHQVAIHAYVLMSNHVHLLVTPHSEESCGRMMQSVGRRYVPFVNTRYERSGTLWEGRYKSTLVDTDTYLFTVSRYIELNPVRAGMVVSPQEYHWSSYWANALGGCDTLVTPHELYLKLGQDPLQRQRNYRSLFDRGEDPELLDSLREATNKGAAFGTEEFRIKLRDTAR